MKTKTSRARLAAAARAQSQTRKELARSLSGPSLPTVDTGGDGGIHYTPWLVVRCADGDDGSRPLPGGTVFWESPDVWSVSSNGNINQPAPNDPTQVFARVSNLGRADAYGVQVKFWWANPSLAITEQMAYLIGTGSANISSQSSAAVPCSGIWLPQVVNGGHECLLAEAFISAFDPLTAPMDPVDDRHVGQKNEQLLILPPGKPFSITLQGVNFMSLSQALTFEVQPVRLARLPTLLAMRQKNLSMRLLPPTTTLPLSFRISDSPALFTGPSAVFARRLLSATLQELAGTDRTILSPAQITQTTSFEPWEVRSLELGGAVPPNAVSGQTFVFRIVQRAGRMIMGGYTVHLVVSDRL